MKLFQKTELDLKLGATVKYEIFNLELTLSNMHKMGLEI